MKKAIESVMLIFPHTRPFLVLAIAGMMPRKGYQAIPYKKSSLLTGCKNAVVRDFKRWQGVLYKRCIHFRRVCEKEEFAVILNLQLLHYWRIICATSFPY